jgi:hypothetical protein
MCTTNWRISQQGVEDAISRKARDNPETPRPAPGGKDRAAARPDPCRLGRAGAGVNGPSLLRWRALATERFVSGGTISWWSVKAQMDSEHLLAALRDDIEWPAAPCGCCATTWTPWRRHSRASLNGWDRCGSSGAACTVRARRSMPCWIVEGCLA